MEKFGIFELLDALCALSEGEEAPAPAEDAAPSSPSEGTPPAEAGTPSPEDAAFSAPVYPAGNAAPPVRGERDRALNEFLARHDAVAKRAKGKKE